jgi:hypothetical protein
MTVREVGGSDVVTLASGGFSVTQAPAAGGAGVTMGENYILFDDISGGTEPTNPAGGRVKLYARLNGSSKVELRARFPSGAFQTIVTEP